MSDRAHNPVSRTRKQPDNVVLPLILVGLAAIFAFQTLSIKTGIYDALTTDDVMRLVEVRDLINGQGWFDLHQYRLDPPGVLMHWSRLVDLPLAVSIVALKPLLGVQGAETVTLIVWPLLLFAVALALVVAIVRQLTNGSLAASIAAVVLALMAKPTLLHFRPGAIDHHNVQMVLLLALILFVLQIERSAQKAMLAAVSASLSLAVGVEMLPAIAAVCLAIVGLFIWRGASVEKPVVSFAIALAASSLGLAIALLPSPEMLAPVCDALGGPLLLLTVGGGIGLTLMVVVDRFYPARSMRFASAAIAGLVLISLFGLHYGRCLASPYAQLDPLVASLWLDKVQETVSLARMIQLGPEEIPGFYGLPLLTLAVAFAALIKCQAEEKFRWLLGCMTLFAGFIVSVWQIRGTPGANILAAPFFVAAITVVWPSLAAGRSLALLAFVVSPTTLAVAGALAKPITDAIFKPDTTIVSPSQCGRLSDVAPMQGLARGRVLAPIDLGPTILAETSHDVIAAPFHRNNAGNLAMLQIMLAPPQVARRMMIDRQIDYVVICRASPDMQLIERAPEGLEAVLTRGDRLGFLEPVALEPQARIAVWRFQK